MGLVPRRLSRAAHEYEKKTRKTWLPPSPSSTSRARFVPSPSTVAGDARPLPLLPIPPSSPTCRISGDDNLVRIQTTVAAKTGTGSSKQRNGDSTNCKTWMLFQQFKNAGGSKKIKLVPAKQNASGSKNCKRWALRWFKHTQNTHGNKKWSWYQQEN